MAKIISSTNNNTLVVQRRTRHIGITTPVNGQYSLVLERETVTTLNGEVIKQETEPIREIEVKWNQEVVVGNKSMTCAELAQFIAQFCDDMDSDQA